MSAPFFLSFSHTGPFRNDHQMVRLIVGERYNPQSGFRQKFLPSRPPGRGIGKLHILHSAGGDSRPHPAGEQQTAARLQPRSDPAQHRPMFPDREMKERKDFEENNFVRVNRTHEQKKRERQATLALQRGQKIGEFDEFDSLTRLTRESDKIASQIIDEDEFGNRVKRVQVDETHARRGGKRGKKGRR